MKIGSRLRLRGRAVALYIFFWGLIALGGAYFGGVLLYLSSVLFLVPLFSLLFFVFSVTGVRFSQTFSTDHPVKGEPLYYKVLVANEWPFGISRLSSSFVISNPLMEEMVPDFHLSLPGKKTREFTYSLTCSYRGIYRVGLEGIVLRDVLDLISLNLPVRDRTFYVYPRIIDIRAFPFGGESLYASGSQASMAGITDPTLLKNLDTGARILPMRRVYWKKFAATGIPAVKQLEKATSPGVALYLDLYNPASKKSIAVLEREDVAVEVLTALVKHYLSANVAVSVRSPCKPVFSFRGRRPEDFPVFHKQSITLFSGPYASPFQLFRMDRHNGELEAKSIIFITHRVEREIFNFALEAVGSRMRIMIIFNHTSALPPQRKENSRYLAALRDRGVRILEVQGPATIARDLENDSYA